jgi:hypothetical protein
VQAEVWLAPIIRFAGESGNQIGDGVRLPWVPAKVVRAAIQNAASVAALLITTEAMIAELPKKNAPADGGMSPGSGMGGMDFLSSRGIAQTCILGLGADYRLAQNEWYCFMAGTTTRRDRNVGTNKDPFHDDQSAPTQNGGICW